MPVGAHRPACQTSYSGVGFLQCRHARVTVLSSAGSTVRAYAEAVGLDAGVSRRDMQDFARHADPKTTRRYDRSRHALNRHATYAIAHELAGGN
jgi:hypothetical protein